MSGGGVCNQKLSEIGEESVEVWNSVSWLVL